MIRVAAITDEFSPDLHVALDGMAALGITGVELRTIAGRNIVEHSDDEIAAISRTLDARGMQVVAIASPVLKCVLPDAPPIDERFQQDVFGSSYSMDDQPRLIRRAFDIAEQTGAPILRVFSYWRTVDPSACLDRIEAAIAELADEGQRRGVVVGLENEHACNVGSGAESAAFLNRLAHPALALIWDPANASILGETPYPDGYRALPIARVAHVHAKDCTVNGHTPTWGPIGEMSVGWREQISALAADGYAGWISLETHWRGPRGNKFEASTICGRKLQALVNDAR